ncbi:MAG: DUF2283 domain-containing protein [Thermoplasmata archaeon]|nr:DUF2283 domain-containing protein [Thermoplasmata archaeon]
MEEKLRFFFDKEGDVLDISIGDPKSALSKELDDDIIIRVNDNKKIVGITILNFQKRFKENLIPEEIPIKANFVMAE